MFILFLLPECLSFLVRGELESVSLFQSKRKGLFICQPSSGNPLSSEWFFKEENLMPFIKILNWHRWLMRFQSFCCVSYQQKCHRTSLRGTNCRTFGNIQKMMTFRKTFLLHEQIAPAEWLHWEQIQFFYFSQWL